MELVSKYVREQKRYAKNELKHLFEFDESGIEKFLKTLKSYGIIKCVDNNNKQLEMTDLLDEDIEIKKGDRIGQAIFTPYLVADNDTANGERNGGFGSTN